MSIINNVPRWMIVLTAMVVLAVLIWIFALNTDHYYYSIGGAVLVTIGIVFAVYHTNPSEKRESKNKKPAVEGEAGQKDLESEMPQVTSGIANRFADGLNSSEIAPVSAVPDGSRQNYQRSIDKLISFRSAPAPRPDAVEVAAKYFRMARLLDGTGNEAQEAIISLTAQVQNEVTKAENEKQESANGTGTDPEMPLIDDETTLTDDDKISLLSSVWYRCENPYCKYTRFLGVHHILDEKDGGTNKLDNLIVLCPYCHDLAHRKEIPEKEMRDWIGNQEARFKSRPDWRFQ